MAFDIKPTVCEEPKCKDSYVGHKWGSIKAHAEGWYQQKDGRAWCPKHRPSWAPAREGEQMQVKLSQGGSIGTYNVWVDGKKVGIVFKKEDRYNLRRPVTVVSWRVAGDKDQTHYRTRREAVQAVVNSL